MGIDLPALPAKGSHRFKLNRIIATKSYFPQKQILPVVLGLIGINLLLLIIQGLLKYFSYRYKEETQTLRTAMVIDPLTQCLNRLGLEAAIASVFPLSGRSAIYVMVVDLDHFKNINDTLGHAVGDDVLRDVSLALSGELRSDDVFGRWGGEEFVIISKISHDNLENLIARLMRSLQDISVDGAPENYKVTISVGVTEARIGEPFHEVFKRNARMMPCIR
jgi:diguanylate cyclase (GGDEF)-like protein